MHITLVQTPIVWEAPEQNRAHYESLLEGVETDLVILPEMFPTGFTMKPQNVAENMDGASVNWLRTKAAEWNAAVAGSIAIQEDGAYFNRLIWAFPDGNIQAYNKRHLFRMAGEHHVYQAGQERLIVEWKGWNICPMICYDLRFPVWSRNQANAYDVLIYVANWPAVRSKPWQQLLQARAVENLAYVVGVNRVGEDGNGWAYNGCSAVIDYKGEVLKEEKDKECLIQQTLDKKELTIFRERFPAWMDADNFIL